MVEEVLDQWYGPEHVFFKVRADDGNVYILRHQTSALDGDWNLISFRGPADQCATELKSRQDSTAKAQSRLLRAVPRAIL